MIQNLPKLLLEKMLEITSGNAGHPGIMEKTFLKLILKQELSTKKYPFLKPPQNPFVNWAFLVSSSQHLALAKVMLVKCSNTSV